jgi:hypothetical protein
MRLTMRSSTAWILLQSVLWIQAASAQRATKTGFAKKACEVAAFPDSDGPVARALARQPATALDFQAVAQPGTTIGGNRLTPPVQSGRPPEAQDDDLENDPAFKRLSPQAQDWVRTMSNRLDTAVQQKDVNAIGQLELDVTKHQLIGMTVCGHPVDEGTFVDAEAFNASSEEAIAIRWLDPRGTVVHSAIFTGRKRCVVTDGDAIEGKSILRAMPNSLAVSDQHALTAWEGSYWDSPSERSNGGAPHRGVFIENRFLVELDPHKASPPDSRDLSDQDRDFHWNDEREVVNMKPGVFLASATASPLERKAAPPATAQARNAQTAPAGCPAEDSDKNLPFHPLKVQQALNKNAGKIADQTGAGKDAQGNPCATPAPNPKPVIP